MLGDQIAIVRPRQPQRDVGLAPFQTDVANVGGHFNVEARKFVGKRRKPRDEESLRQSRRTADAHKALRLVIRAAAAERGGCAFHFGCCRKHAGARRRQHVAVGAAFDEFFIQGALKRRDPPCDGGVIDAKRPRGRRQTAVPGQCHEDADILPIELCANLISH